MKYIISSLSIIALMVINTILNNISQGNILGIGLGDYIFKVIGLWCVWNALNKNIFK